MIPTSLHTGIEGFLRKKFSSAVEIKNFSPIGGGCINACGKLQTSTGIFFLKWNDRKKFPGMLETEAKGLRRLRETQVIFVPEVIGVGEVGDIQFILMEFVVQQSHSERYWEDFGHQLANLHRVTDETFGLDHSNYIGSLEQFNKPHSSWFDFFIHERLAVQVKLAIASNQISAAMLKKFDQLYDKLSSLLPVEEPSLLHGDLWSGNLMVNETGAPAIIDPAVYFGHREADLAMTQLFGGFDARYLESYHEVFPLTPGFNDRIDLYNLYPLLVHVNLFGGSFIHQVNTILHRYVN